MSGRGLFASFPTIRNGRFGRFPGETVRLKRRMKTWFTQPSTWRAPTRPIHFPTTPWS